MDEELVKQYTGLLIKKVRIGDSTLWTTAGIEEMDKRLQAVEDELSELEDKMSPEELQCAGERYREWFRRYLLF